MSAPNKPFTLVATLIAKGPKEADEVVSLVTAIAKRANTDAEPGTKSYRLTREVDGGLKIVVLEEYDNAAALKAHQASPEFVELAKQAPNLTSHFDMAFLDTVYP